MSDTKNVISFVAENLRRYDLHVKVSELLNYIVEKGFIEDTDRRNKFTGPDDISEDVVSEIINEYGFQYINNMTDLLTGIERNILVHFISLLHLLKGHRSGLELVLTILGFDFLIEEWWEQDPKGVPMTFNMTVFFNLSQIAPGVSVFEVLDSLRVFAREYVYPIFDVANVVFDFEFAPANTAMAGFTTQEKQWEILASL